MKRKRIVDLHSEQQNAIIFDLDGTLIDIESVYLDAHAEVLSAHGIAYGKEEHIAFLRDSPQKAGRMLVEGTSMTLADFNNQRHVLVRQNAHKADDLPGASGFLHQLREMNCDIGLATNSPTFDCHEKIKPREWREVFDVIVCGDHAEVASPKPSPDIYLLSARKLGRDPKDCIVFEDSPFGIEAAMTAGMFVIAIQSEYVDQSILAAANVVIEDFTDTDRLMRLCGL